MIATPAPRLSIVVPIFNEAENLVPLFERLFPVLEDLGLSHEVIAVDDGSVDATPAILEAEADRRKRLRVVTLARNFGQHAALFAGFESARGDWIITLDADLQNPPEEIPKLVEALQAGHDLVNTVRRERHDTLFRRLGSALNGSIIRRLSGINMRDFGCMLRGYHRSVIEAIIEMKELGVFIPALGALNSCHPTEIEVEHAARELGRSKYSVLNLLRLQLDLIMTFSISPLRILFSMGSVIAALSMVFGVLLIVLRLWFGASWAGEGVFTLFAILFFLVGTQFIAFGLLGEYIGRIYQHIRYRPTYIIRRSRTVPHDRGAHGSGDLSPDTVAEHACVRSGLERCEERT